MSIGPWPVACSAYHCTAFHCRCVLCLCSQLLQPACVSLSFSLQPLPAKLQRPGALLLQLSRMIEVWLAAEAGAANVRQWLMVSRAALSWLSTVAPMGPLAKVHAI
jgi:hypothetical protein